MELPRGWWAVYTRHHHEHKVGEMLKAKGLDTFCPTWQSPRRWKDRVKILPMPLFPCYVFVREKADAKLAVVSTPGVHMIVTRGEQFAVIADEEIEAIRRASTSAVPLQPCAHLRAGERVRVVAGPLRGIEGILLRKAGQCRLVLSVDLLGQSASVELSATDIAMPCRPFSAQSGAVLPARPQKPIGLTQSASGMRCL